MEDTRLRCAGNIKVGRLGRRLTVGSSDNLLEELVLRYRMAIEGPDWKILQPFQRLLARHFGGGSLNK